MPLVVGSRGAKVCVCIWGRILALSLEQILWFSHRGFAPGDTQRDPGFQVTVLDAFGSNQGQASLALRLCRQADIPDCMKTYLGLMRATERESWHLVNQWRLGGSDTLGAVTESEVQPEMSKWKKITRTKKVGCLPKFMFLEKKVCTSAYVQVSFQGCYCVHAHVHAEPPASTLISISCRKWPNQVIEVE